VTNMVSLGIILLSELCGRQIRETLVHRQHDLLHHLPAVMLELSFVTVSFSRKCCNLAVYGTEFMGLVHIMELYKFNAFMNKMFIVRLTF
jgi:hypothetical protein